MNKLNLGSSCPRGRYLEGWLNLDYCKYDRISLRGSALALPFRDNSFDLIHSVHVLEHLTRDKPIVMLKECYRVLKPGGRAFIEVPDGEKIVYLLADAYTNKDYKQAHIWTTSLTGKNDRPGMAHYSIFSLNKIVELSQEAGFSKLRHLNTEAEMISRHYWQEPVILVELIK